MSAALGRTIAASQPAWRWIEEWAGAHNGHILSGPKEISRPAADLFHGIAQDHRSGALVVEKNPAKAYRLPDLPEGAEFVLMKGGEDWAFAFALKHGDAALWLGYRGLGDDSYVWPATPAEYTAFMAFTVSGALAATGASPLAEAWVEALSRANHGEILGADEIGTVVCALLAIVAMDYHDGRLVVGENPGSGYSLSDLPDLPEGAEFVPIEGSGFQGFAFKHDAAIWLGFHPADILEVRGHWPATPAEYAAFMAFTR